MLDTVASILDTCPMNFKTCPRCKESKPYAQFFKSSRTKDGLYPYCKDCNRDICSRYELTEEQKKRYQANKRIYLASPLGRENQRAAGRRHYYKHLMENRARDKTRKAILAGILVRKPCEKCGSTPSEAHHDDYSKPLKVRWLCRKHHREHHTKQRKLSKSRAKE